MHELFPIRCENANGDVLLEDATIQEVAKDLLRQRVDRSDDQGEAELWQRTGLVGSSGAIWRRRDSAVEPILSRRAILDEQAVLAGQVRPEG